MIGKSSCSSVASRLAKRSNTSLTTSTWRSSGLSILLMQTIGRRPTLSAFDTTNLVCGIGPSAASTSTMAPSTMLRMRSTSPPKSAWPGVSTMLMRMSFQTTEVAFARMVMPRSRSRSLESIIRSDVASFSRNEPDCFSRQSTSVVLPWSTWAMMAMLRSCMADRFRFGRGGPNLCAAIQGFCEESEGGGQRAAVNPNQARRRLSGGSESSWMAGPAASVRVAAGHAAGGCR